MFAVVISVLATVMPAARAWPQAIRIIRIRNVSGVSALAWSLVLANFTIWGVYGAMLGLWVIIVANVAAALGAVAVLFGLAHHHVTSWFRPLGIIVGTVVVALASNIVAGHTFVWALATGLAVCMFLPQVREAFRNDPTGISPVTWWLGIVAGLVWLGYAWSVGQLQLAAPHLVMTPCAIAILWRVYTFESGRSEPEFSTATGDLKLP